MSLVSGLVNNNQIVITHVATGFQVSFAAFLDTFSDAFQSNWNEESVFGRMDSIATFRNTERALALAWAVPANSFEEAQENLGKINQMISFLYPLYDQGAGGATLINQSPLVRIKFGNLVQNINGDGLLGWLHGITFDPMMDNGFWVLRTEIDDGTKVDVTEYQIVPDIQPHHPQVCLATQFKLSTKDTAFMSHKDFMKAVDTCDRKNDILRAMFAE